MKRITFLGFVMIVVAIILGLVGFNSIIKSEMVATQTGSTFDHIQISAIFDNRRNQEYLYIFDKRDGAIWKYNMDAPGQNPKYIGKISELGQVLEESNAR